MKNDNEEYAAVKNKKAKADRELLTILLILILYIFLGFGAVSLVSYESWQVAWMLCLLGSIPILCIYDRRGKLAYQLKMELESMQKPPKKTEGYYVGDTYLERYIDDE
jgi:hypothetical protein